MWIKSLAEDRGVSAKRESVDGYELRGPGAQNALDIFSGEWTSALPLPDGAGLVAGSLPLFADPKVQWALTRIGGVVGLRVLELGPLEGGHSWLLERSGAREVVAIEANRRAFLRCLVLKEILGLTRVRYMCGDFGPYLRESQDSFDVVLASGVLYHQVDPMQMLSDLGRLAPAVFMWTHYYEADRIEGNARLEGKVGPVYDAEFNGLRYSRAEFRYEKALEWSGFCGGSQAQCHWLPREDILSGLRAFGFREIEIAFEDPDHPNGPCFAIVARK